MTSSSLVGTLIENKYSLDEQIGHGGMGAVFRGTQLMVDRTVAIKLLQAEYASHDNFKARFEVEAKAIGRMNHPNCITLFDFGYSQNIEAFYTVVEYINGRSLGALLEDPISLPAIVSVIRQIASGLDHAHHHGILHRDLKPENIMLAQMTDGTEMIKVLDFGIAQIIKGTGPGSQHDPNDQHAPKEDDFEVDRITRVGEVFGTPPYMSPEQARSTRNLTPACDLYSLGVIFYELVAGQLPFFSDSPLDILLMHINEPPPHIERLKSLPELHSVIMALLEKDPEHRIQSGQELITRLDAISPEFLELESSQIVHQTAREISLASPHETIGNAYPLDAHQRSWVETVDPAQHTPAVPAFAPPPQAQRSSASNSKVVPTNIQPLTVSSGSAEKTSKYRSKAFDTVVNLDEVVAQSSLPKTTRWYLLVIIAALTGVLIVLMIKFDTELMARLPFTANKGEQTAPVFPRATRPTNANLAVAQDSPDDLVEAAEPDKVDENAPTLPVDKPTARIADDTSEDFPEATRPATKKQTAKKSTNRRKKTNATTSSKAGKMKNDDSSNPPSKGPRILEF